LQITMTRLRATTTWATECILMMAPYTKGREALMTRPHPPRDPYSLYQGGVKVAEVDGIRTDIRDLYIDQLFALTPFQLDRPFEFRGKIYQFNSGAPPRLQGAKLVYSHLSAVDLGQV
jgi:hypothetical protein